MGDPWDAIHDFVEKSASTRGIRRRKTGKTWLGCSSETEPSLAKFARRGFPNGIFSSEEGEVRGKKVSRGPIY